jgi:PHD/YefM family antitoxin component YafN of YafNO toxin-antitoxin module
MAFTVQTTDLRRRSREILDRIRMKKEAAIIQSYDTPQAVLIPYEHYEDYLTWRESREKRAAWMNELRRIAEEVSNRANLADEQIKELIEEAKSSNRGVDAHRPG